MFWDSIKDSDNPDAFEAYLSKFPHGIFVPLANIKIKELSKYKKNRLNLKFKMNLSRTMIYFYMNTKLITPSMKMILLIRF